MTQDLAELIVFEPPRETCPHCGNSGLSKEFTRTFLGHPWRYSRCKACHLVFQNPRATADAMDALLNSDEYWSGRRFSDPLRRIGYLDYAEHRESLHRQALMRTRFVARFAPPPARLLDVGCASGYFTGAALRAGYEAEGLEPSRRMADLARQRHGVRIRVGYAEQLKAMATSGYDVITFWGCFSNLRDPAEALRQSARALLPGGMLFLNSIAFDHPLRWTRGRRFGYLPSVLHLFDRRLVLEIARQASFALVERRRELFYTELDQLFWALSPRLGLASLSRNLITRVYVPGASIYAFRRV